MAKKRPKKSLAPPSRTPERTPRKEPYDSQRVSVVVERLREQAARLNQLARSMEDSGVADVVVDGHAMLLRGLNQIDNFTDNASRAVREAKTALLDLERMSLYVYFLPTLVSPPELAGKTVVVIDVLRATTTIVQALASGAKEVIPCLEVEQTRKLAGECAGPHVLGGERGGVKIARFNFGNSPAEYTSAAVLGKTVFFTTTNGTRAMTVCTQAKRVLLGAFTNLSSLCGELAKAEQVAIVCAGTDHQITREDVLLAGAIVDRLLPGTTDLNDDARIAADAWRGSRAAGESLEQLLGASQGGRNLAELGYGSDIRLAAHVDLHTLVPELLIAAWKIIPAPLSTSAD